MSWDGEIILSPPMGEASMLIVDEGNFRFYHDGSFRFANRSFRHKQAVDLDYDGFHVFREEGGRRLFVHCPDGELIIFQCEWTLAGARWIRWTPRATDGFGTPDENPQPGLIVSLVMVVTRAWYNFCGGVEIFFGLVFLLLVLGGVLGTIGSFFASWFKGH